MQEPDLRGRSSLVTGSGRGIGRATALALARCGARVVLTARSRGEIEGVAREIQARAGEAMAIPADVSCLEDVRRLFETAGPVDILINSAGIIAPIAPLAAVDPAEWVRNIAVNLDGVFYTCHEALRGMLARNWGRIVNVSSGAARGSTTGWSAYSAAKAGVEAMTSVLAKEVAEHDIRVNAVRPGVVDTQMQVEIRNSGAERFGAGNLARFRGYKEQGVLRTPEEPAQLILWLLTPEAAELHGEVLYIDDPEIAARTGIPPPRR